MTRAPRCTRGHGRSRSCSPSSLRASCALLLAIALAGCGGGQRSDATPPSSGGGGEQASERPSGGAMIPPEAMDEINRSLERKRRIVSHCLAQAVDNKELPKNSAGKVTLEIVISPAGKAETVKVIRATLDSQSLNDCVIARVKEIQFPELPRPYETSYTYGFEAM
jgi:hypothetical protein